MFLWNVFKAHFCLIAFARDIPILVKKLLKREAMVFEVLCSTPSDMTEVGPLGMKSVYHGMLVHLKFSMSQRDCCCSLLSKSHSSYRFTFAYFSIY